MASPPPAPAQAGTTPASGQDGSFCGSPDEALKQLQCRLGVMDALQRQLERGLARLDDKVCTTSHQVEQLDIRIAAMRKHHVFAGPAPTEGGDSALLFDKCNQRIADLEALLVNDSADCSPIASPIPAQPKLDGYANAMDRCGEALTARMEALELAHRSLCDHVAKSEASSGSLDSIRKRVQEASKQQLAHYRQLCKQIDVFGRRVEAGETAQREALDGCHQLQEAAACAAASAAASAEAAAAEAAVVRSAVAAGATGAVRNAGDDQVIPDDKLGAAGDAGAGGEPKSLANRVLACERALASFTPELGAVRRSVEASGAAVQAMKEGAAADEGRQQQLMAVVQEHRQDALWRLGDCEERQKALDERLSKALAHAREACSAESAVGVAPPVSEAAVEQQALEARVLRLEGEVNALIGAEAGLTPHLAALVEQLRGLSPKVMQHEARIQEMAECFAHGYGHAQSRGGIRSGDSGLVPAGALQGERSGL